MRQQIQKFGRALSGMVMPNIGAFIAWGFVTALFIPSGWWPNTQMARLVDPMLTYLLPLLIAYTAGRNVAGERGGVIGAIAAMGVIVGSDIPMFIGAMVMGPLGGYTIRWFDKLTQGRIKAGFEMLVSNFSIGILGMLLAILGYWVYVNEYVLHDVLRPVPVQEEACVGRQRRIITAAHLVEGFAAPGAYGGYEFCRLHVRIVCTKLENICRLASPPAFFVFRRAIKTAAGMIPAAVGCRSRLQGTAGCRVKSPGTGAPPCGSQLADTNVLVRSSFRVSGLLVVMKSIPHAMQVIMSCTVSTVHTFVTMPLACASLTHPGLPE